MKFSDRFRGYLPVVVDLETGGFDNSVNPILEVACTFLQWQEDEISTQTHGYWSVVPFSQSEIDPASLKVTGIDLDDPDRQALDEKVVLGAFFKMVRTAMKVEGCHRAIMVAHNAAFDLGFLSAACVRTGMKRSPFHPFTTLDTASLAALAYGHTVLSEACRRAGLSFDATRAHNAAYDAERTAQLFCQMVNRWPYTPMIEGMIEDGVDG
jgi:ribonuclease T